VEDLDDIPEMKLMDHVAGIVLDIEPHVEWQSPLPHFAGQDIPRRSRAVESSDSSTPSTSRTSRSPSQR
jgi:hypothetical protein